MTKLRQSKRRITEADVAKDSLDAAQDVLNRMRENHQAGKGINLSAAELNALSVTRVGDLWAQDDPRVDS